MTQFSQIYFQRKGSLLRQYYSIFEANLFPSSMDEFALAMGPIKYRAYCRAQADPAYLKAVRDRTWAKFSKYPGAVNGPPRPESQPPPPSNHSGDSVTGLLSPSGSEHGDPVNPPEKTADGSNKEGASGSSDRVPERVNRSPVVPKQSKKTSSGNDSRMSKSERRERKIRTRATRSKASSASSSSELGETNQLSVGPGSPAATATSSGKDSPHLEHALRKSVPQTSTKATPSKPAAKSKRKRDEDDDPTRKRARVETSTNIPSADSGPAEAANKKSDTTETGPSRIETWLEEQEHVYKPMQSTTSKDDLDASSSTMKQTAEVQESLLPDPKSKQILESATPNQPLGRRIDESALRMLITRNRTSRDARPQSSTNSDQGRKVSRKCFFP